MKFGDKWKKITGGGESSDKYNNRGDGKEERKTVKRRKTDKCQSRMRQITEERAVRERDML